MFSIFTQPCQYVLCVLLSDTCKYQVTFALHNVIIVVPICQLL